MTGIDVISRPVVRDGVRSWLLVLLLTAANVLAYFDRQLIALFLEPVRIDFGRSDTTMGLLYGSSFSIVYALAGVPVTWLAYRWNRSLMIAVAVMSWSVMTVASGVVASFAWLVILRIGVGISEAGLAPTAMSLIAERFTGRMLGLALGLFISANYLGNGLALMTGGLLAHMIGPTTDLLLPLLGPVRGWKLIFMLVGAPGLLLGALFCLVPDPRRGGRLHNPYGGVIAYVAGRRGHYLAMVAAFGLMVMVGSQANAWIPTLLARRFGWSTARIGFDYGLVTLVAGTSGAVAAGRVASVFRARGTSLVGSGLPLCCLGILLPLETLYPLMPTGGALLAVDGAMLFFAAASLTFGFAVLAGTTSADMRGVVTAIYTLMLSLIGPGLGPALGPALSDHLLGGSARLPLALSIVGGVASLLSIGCFVVVTRSGVSLSRSAPPS